MTPLFRLEPRRHEARNFDGTKPAGMTVPVMRCRPCGVSYFAPAPDECDYCGGKLVAASQDAA